MILFQYELLRTVENIKLAPSVLEPEPVELGLMGKDGKPLPNQRQGPAGPDGRWSGDATRGMGLRAEDQKLSVTFGEASADKEQATREMPIWMQQSTVTQDADDSNSGMAIIGGGKDEEEEGGGAEALSADQSDEITSMLLRHEKRSSSQAVIPGRTLEKYFDVKFYLLHVLRC